MLLKSLLTLSASLVSLSTPAFAQPTVVGQYATTHLGFCEEIRMVQEIIETENQTISKFQEALALAPPESSRAQSYKKLIQSSVDMKARFEKQLATFSNWEMAGAQVNFDSNYEIPNSKLNRNILGSIRIFPATESADGIVSVSAGTSQVIFYGGTLCAALKSKNGNLNHAVSSVINELIEKR